MERQPCRHVSMDAGDTPATTDSIAGMSIAIELQLYDWCRASDRLPVAALSMSAEDVACRLAGDRRS